MLGSWLLCTQPLINFNVSFLTVLIFLITCCLITWSPFCLMASLMFSLRHLYTFSMSRYMMPSWGLYFHQNFVQHRFNLSLQVTLFCKTTLSYASLIIQIKTNLIHVFVYLRSQHNFEVICIQTKLNKN